MGESVAQFEKAVASFAKRKHGIAVTSGTSALMLALHARGVGPGWKVFLPAYTWVATYNVVLQLGAQPVLVDIDPLTYTMDRGALVRALESERASGRTAPLAIMPVHMFGFRCGEGWLDALAQAFKLTVVGDGCAAFGGTASGQRCGAWTPVECFSFHPRKVVTTGEGGMVLCDDDELAARMRALRDHGAVRSADQRRQTVQGGVAVPDFPEAGFNLRMSEMQGALGLSQMRRIDESLAKRRLAANTYDYLLETGPSWLRPPSLSCSGVVTAASYEPNLFDDRILTFYPVSLWGSRSPGAPAELTRTGDARARTRLAALQAWRDRLVSELARLGVAARPPMTALSELPYVHARSAVRPEDFPNTYAVYRLTFALPLHTALTKEDAMHVVRLLSNIPSTWHSKQARDDQLRAVLEKKRPSSA